jgi:hypothetical protein
MGFLDNIKELVTLSKSVKEAQAKLNLLNKQLEEAEVKRRAIDTLNSKIAELQEKNKAAENSLLDIEGKAENQRKKLNRAAVIIKSIMNATEKFSKDGSDGSEEKLLTELIQLEPTVILKTHGENLKELRKQISENKKLIDVLLKTYQERYTTKANATIYSLLVIALRAEIQNVLYNLKYDRLDKAISEVKEMTKKYLAIVTEGNQSIAPTITRFIGQIEFLFIEALKIEYEYFVKQEQIKEEQRAIREQMRQEAEERRILEQQKKQIEQEESKYLAEIKNVQAQLNAADTEETRIACEQRLAAINTMFGELEGKKEEILKLQNGQAGYVYVISNLGSFGDHMFKIGMTRRLEPIDRINELSDASVPFNFDIHAMIFSENAVTLENKLHEKFDDRRVNKINRRREFFKTSIDELQTFVNDLEPSTEFNTTMMAEQYRQSLAINEGIIDLTDVIEETDVSNENDKEDVNE